MNLYLEIVWNTSLKNEAATEYISLCESALNRIIPNGYIEKHHILPKCICNDIEQINDKINLVKFSAREHFIAHRLLSEMFTGVIKRKMLYALSALSFRKNGIRVLDEDDYEITKEASRAAKKGIPLTKEHKQKIRDTFAKCNPNRGRKVSQKTKDKQSSAKLGTTRSQAVKDSISNSLTGVPKGKQPLLSCVICRKSGGSHGIVQHHFDKCKGA